jgi:hypothetical protein
LAETVCALGATTIDLCLLVFPWAPSDRRRQAAKLHRLVFLINQFGLPALSIADLYGNDNCEGGTMCAECLASYFFVHVREFS